VMPLGIVGYLFFAPARRRARRALEAASIVPVAMAPDDGRHAARDTVAPVRKEP